MEIFLDTANLEEIERWLDCGVLDGVTTNPSIMLKDGGYDLRAAGDRHRPAGRATAGERRGHRQRP